MKWNENASKDLKKIVFFLFISIIGSDDFIILQDSNFVRSCECKVKKISKGSLNSISSPSVKIQIMGGKVCLCCIGKTLLGVVKKLLKTKSLLTSPSNVLSYYRLSYYLKETLAPIIWIFTEGDEIETRLSS